MQNDCDHLRVITFADVKNHGSRAGNATLTDSCEVISNVPKHLRDMRFMKPTGISRYYEKYTEAYGIPVIGNHSSTITSNVSAIKLREITKIGKGYENFLFREDPLNEALFSRGEARPKGRCNVPYSRPILHPPSYS